MRYDLEERTLKFSKDIINFTRKQIRDSENLVIIKQLIRSATSIGANYIEANEKLSPKDFLHRIKISKKETKETIYWLNLIKVNEHQESEKEMLLNEATELMKILATIITNFKNKISSTI